MGLWKYAAAGAAKAYGEGIVERAQALATAAMEERKEAVRQAERMEERAWKVEDRDLTHARADARSAGSGRRSSGGSSAEADPAAARTALREAGIPTPDPALMREIEARVAAGENMADVIADLDVPEEVTNRGGTAVGRGVGIVSGWVSGEPFQEPPPDATAPGRPTGFRRGGLAGSTSAPAVQEEAVQDEGEIDVEATLEAARDAIARGADRVDVMQMLRKNGIDPALL